MSTIVALSGAKRRCLGPLVALGLVAALPASGATPLNPARQYAVQGDAALTVAGSHCCGGTRFTGRFDAAYQIESTGTVTLARLSVVLDDADVTVSDGFLGLFTSTAHMRCASAGSSAPAYGTQLGTSTLKFVSGAIPVAGLSAEERYSDGSCADPSLEMLGANNADANVVHDPVGDHFGLGTTFSTTIGGDSYGLSLQLDGHFVNRPPVAVMGIETPENPQGGCPAVWRWNGQTWEPVVEANNFAGFKGTLHSTSYDPDGPWAHADVLNERWFLSRDAGARALLGNGPYLGPLNFEWGPRHQVELLTADQAGATAATACTFRVVDTLPPVVTAPPPLVTGCTTTGGITPATSAQLRGFLASATAVDRGDVAPVALTPKVGTTDVVSTTLFPADGTARTVTFGFRDRAGNVGSAGSTVTVVDTVKPAVTVALVPGALPAAGKWYWITATISATDDCGGSVAMRLVSIVSNAPAFDASDIFDASYGTDDRGFYLFERLAAPGVVRIYKVTYEGRDAAGNVVRVSASVTVG